MSTLDLARSMRREPTRPEHRLWQAIRNKQVAGLRFRRQVPLGAYIVDFFCPEVRLIVETDGATHVGSERDAVRDAWLASQGLRVLRFWNNDVMLNLPGVLESIVIASSPLPPREGVGEGVAAGACRAADPPPRPSPAVGEGEGSGADLDG